MIFLIEGRMPTPEEYERIIVDLLLQIAALEKATSAGMRRLRPEQRPS